MFDDVAKADTMTDDGDDADSESESAHLNGEPADSDIEGDNDIESDFEMEHSNLNTTKRVQGSLNNCYLNGLFPGTVPEVL